MRITLSALVLSALTACSSVQEEATSFRGFSAGVTGGMAAGGDTYGTSRRPDVYGAFTRPTTPTIGSRN